MRLVASTFLNSCKYGLNIVFSNSYSLLVGKWSLMRSLVYGHIGTKHCFAWCFFDVALIIKHSSNRGDGDIGEGFVLVTELL